MFSVSYMIVIVGCCNLFSSGDKWVVEGVRVVVVDKFSVRHSSEKVIGEEGCLPVVVNRNSIKEIVYSEVYTIFEDRKFVCKCLVCEPVGVVVRIPEHLMYVGSLQLLHDYDTNQSFRHVG